jgi:hypothetical protein
MYISVFVSSNLSNLKNVKTVTKSGNDFQGYTWHIETQRAFITVLA